MLHIDVIKKIKSAKGKDQLTLDISVKTNAITAVFGNSGEGKSTLLNMIAGFVRPEQGLIRYHDECWFSSKDNIHIKTRERNIAYIFQENNLYPHFTVKQNIEYALNPSRKSTQDLEALLMDLGIEKLQDRYPNQLSVGQTQRVAMARALAQKARIVLMDEPFSALDLEIKLNLYRLIKDFHRKHQLCILLVSHDLQDIEQVCNEVIWIEDHKAKEVLRKEDFNRRIEQKINKMTLRN